MAPGCNCLCDENIKFTSTAVRNGDLRARARCPSHDWDPTSTVYSFNAVVECMEHITHKILTALTSDKIEMIDMDNAGGTWDEIIIRTNALLADVSEVNDTILAVAGGKLKSSIHASGGPVHNLQETTNILGKYYH